MKGTKPTKILVGGDRTAANRFIGPANSQMEILKKQMSFQNRSQGVRRVWLHDDVYVECIKCFNYQECKIWVRPVVDESVKDEPKFYKLLLVYGNGKEIDGTRRNFQEYYNYKIISMENGVVSLKDPEREFDVISPLDNTPPSGISQSVDEYEVVHEWTKTLDDFMVSPFVFFEKGIGTSHRRWAVTASLNGVAYKWEEVEIPNLGVIEENTHFPGVIPEANYVWNNRTDSWDHLASIDFKGFIRDTDDTSGYVNWVKRIGRRMNHVGFDVWSEVIDGKERYFVGIMCDHCGKEQGFLTIWEADPVKQKMILKETVFSAAREQSKVDELGMVNTAWLMGYGYQSETEDHVAYWYILPYHSLYSYKEEDAKIAKEVLAGPSGYSISTEFLYDINTNVWSQDNFFSWCWNPTSRDLLINRTKGKTGALDAFLLEVTNDDGGDYGKFYENEDIIYNKDGVLQDAYGWPYFTYAPYEIINYTNGETINSYDLGRISVSVEKRDYKKYDLPTSGNCRYLTSKMMFQMGGGFVYQLAKDKYATTEEYFNAAALLGFEYDPETEESIEIEVVRDMMEFEAAWTEVPELSNNASSELLGFLGSGFSQADSGVYTNDPGIWEYNWVAIFLGGMDGSGNRVPICGIYREDSDTLGDLYFSDQYGNIVNIGPYERAFITHAKSNN